METEATVNQRIASLRTEIEQLRLTIDEINSRKNTIEGQLNNERQYLNVRSASDAFRQRLAESETRLENLLISLTENHPDVVSLKLQMEDYRQAIIDIETNESLGTAPGENNQVSVNPLYDELRRNLAETEVSLNASLHREKTLSRLLTEEYARSERVAARQAELTELTRDYNVTRNLYEDMLARKERARLSMKLDIEGQGTSYKVHEPPVFPLTPSGRQPKEFMMVAPILGLLAPIGIFGLFVFLDPRVRMPSELQSIQEHSLLAVSQPAFREGHSQKLKQDNILSAALFVVTIAVFSWLSATKILGVM